MRIRRCASLLLLSAGLTAVSARAQDDVVGARPAGLGEAFVGVADDANALFWNPAGMVFLDRHEITSMYSDLFGVGLDNSYLAYIYPVTDRVALGIDWFNIGFDDSELEYNLNKFNLAAGFKITSKLAVGGLIRYVNTSTYLDQVSMGRGNGITGDLGVFYRHNDRLSAGIALKPLADGFITYDNGSRAKMEDRSLRAGVGFRAVRSLLVAAEVDDRLHLGGEYMVGDLLALRAGIERDLQGPDKETILAFGTGIKIGPVRFDYARTEYPHLSGTNRFSLSASFNFGHRPVRVKEVKSESDQGLFPSRWLSYRSEPIAEFEVENRTKEPLEVAWTVGLPPFLNPVQRDTILRPQETIRLLPVGEMSEAFYNNTRDRFQPGQLTLSYRKGREDKQLASDFQVLVYSRGAIDWNRDRRWIAAYINPRDEAVRTLTGTLVQRADYAPGDVRILENVSRAMLLFNALKAGGIRYLPDPNNPYAQIQERDVALDDVQYPAELLDSKTGDCDDLTVLFCSMLESIGISTCVLDVPGHLFLMFDTEVPVAHRLALAVPEHWLVARRGRMYVPLEITSVQDSFMKAWELGAAEFDRWDQRGLLSVIDLREAWTFFPAVPIEAPVPFFDLDQTGLLSMWAADMTAFEQLSSDFVQETYYAAIDQPPPGSRGLDELALAAAYNGDLQTAMSLLTRALDAEPGSDRIRNNLANVLALDGQTDSAVAVYRSISNPKYFTEHAVVNLIMARCLSVDPASPTQMSDLKDRIDGLAAQGMVTPAHASRMDDVGHCLQSSPSMSSMDLAACVGSALTGKEEEPTTKGRARGTEPLIDPRIQLFTWD